MRGKQSEGKNFRAVGDFIDRNFRHFNAYAVRAASGAYVEHVEKGGKMLLAMAGSMSTAELGITLAEMIRQDKIHAISCTGANLEEDLFNLVAHEHYEQVPNYMELSPKEEEALLKRGMNRVTDTCIPEEEAIKRIEHALNSIWEKAEIEGKRHFPYEYICELIRSRCLEDFYQIDPKNSWIVAACGKNIPIFTPGWEDSTMGNKFVAKKLLGKYESYGIIKNGLEVMESLVEWYLKNSKKSSVGFFQIGGGIAGDFPICVVPLIQQDMKKNVPCWGYYCQISDSTTSYGSYSGAIPNEKITWGKLKADTPKFIIESDATIVAPLIFAYVLGR